jgi:hypothetical protein
VTSVKQQEQEMKTIVGDEQANQEKELQKSLDVIVSSVDAS